MRTSVHSERGAVAGVLREQLPRSRRSGSRRGGGQEQQRGPRLRTRRHARDLKAHLDGLILKPGSGEDAGDGEGTRSQLMADTMMGLLGQTVSPTPL